jgi:hypothetical protein
MAGHSNGARPRYHCPSTMNWITSCLPTIPKLARRLAVQYVNCESCVTSGVFRLEESLLIVNGIANEMKSGQYGHPEIDSFAFGPVHA